MQTDPFEAAETTCRVGVTRERHEVKMEIYAMKSKIMELEWMLGEKVGSRRVGGGARVERNDY